MVAAAGSITGLRRSSAASIAGSACGLDPHDPHLGTSFLYGAGDSGDEPSASDRHDYGIHIGNLLQQFQTDGALPRDDRWIVKSMKAYQILDPAAALGFFESLVIIGPEENHFRAPGSRRRYLHERRVFRHADLRPNAPPRSNKPLPGHDSRRTP